MGFAGGLSELSGWSVLPPGLRPSSRTVFKLTLCSSASLSQFLPHCKEDACSFRSFCFNSLWVISISAQAILQAGPDPSVYFRNCTSSSGSFFLALYHCSRTSSLKVPLLSNLQLLRTLQGFLSPLLLDSAWWHWMAYQLLSDLYLKEIKGLPCFFKPASSLPLTALNRVPFFSVFQTMLTLIF